MREWNDFIKFHYFWTLGYLETKPNSIEFCFKLQNYMCNEVLLYTSWRLTESDPIRRLGTQYARLNISRSWVTGQVFGLTRSQREEWNCFSKNGLGSEQFSIGGFSLRTRLALSIVSRGAPSTSYVLSEGFHRKSLRSVKKKWLVFDFCADFKQTFLAGEGVAIYLATSGWNMRSAADWLQGTFCKVKRFLTWNLN